LPVAHIGIDDTDSNYLGMCTTYIGALIEDELRGLGYAGAGEPRLVRLNPAYPMKTRGNGAIHLRYRVEGRADALRLFGRVEDILARSAALADSKVDPGLVMIVTPDASPPAALSPIYEEALRRIVSLPAAIRLLASLGAIASWFKSGRGLVGAAAAIGAPEDATRMYELLAYRSPGSPRGPRPVDEESVRIADLETWPMTYDNYDWYSMEALVAPRGPDPVIVGVRGPDRSSVIRAYSALRIGTRVERVAIYRTNHGSGSHVVDVDAVSEIEPYTTVRLEGRVATRPSFERGSHVFFTLEDSRGGRIRVAAYEPTKHFRQVVLGLEPGDRVRVVGSFRPHPPDPPTINLELLEVLELVELRARSAPKCPVCGSRMESEGSGKGYRCTRCGHRDPGAVPVEVRLPRRIVRGTYLPPPRAHRHLTRPVEASLWEDSSQCAVED